MLYEFYSETVYSSCKPLVGFFEIRSHHVAHVGFKFPGSTDPPALASLAPRTTGANYSAQLTRKKALFNLLLFCVHTMFTGCVHRPAMVHIGAWRQLYGVSSRSTFVWIPEKTQVVGLQSSTFTCWTIWLSGSLSVFPVCFNQRQYNVTLYMVSVVQHINCESHVILSFFPLFISLEKA